MTRVVWDPGVPREVRSAFAPYVDRYLPLVPAWVSVLTVEWDDRDTKNRAAMSSDVEYRRGTVFVCPGWMSEDDAERDAAARHEFAHFPLEPLAVFVGALLDAVRENEQLHAWAKEAWRQTLEAATTDVAEAVGRMAPECRA